MSDYFGAMGTAFYSRLTGGTALIAALGGTAIYQDQAPDGASPPYVVYSHQAGAADNRQGGDEREDLWFVRAYAATRPAANVLDGHISGLLHRNNLSVSGWTDIWCVREEQFALTENLPNGERRYAAGAFYRVRLSD
jgi:hypothetical protein